MKKIIIMALSAISFLLILNVFGTLIYNYFKPWPLAEERLHVLDSVSRPWCLGLSNYTRTTIADGHYKKVSIKLGLVVAWPKNWKMGNSIDIKQRTYLLFPGVFLSGEAITVFSKADGELLVVQSGSNLVFFVFFITGCLVVFVGSLIFWEKRWNGSGPGRPGVSR